MKQKRWLALLLTLVMAFSVICPVSVLAADTGYGDEIDTVTGGTYTDTTADADTAYTYTIVGSDGSEATAEVMAAGDATETLTTTPTISWQRTEDTYTAGTTIYRCSSCGYERPSSWYFCPKCLEWNTATRVTTEGSYNYVPNIAYVNSNGSTESGGVTYDRYTALTWNWSELDKLIKDQDTKVNEVWSTQTDNMSACKFSQNGHGASSWDKASVYKISGTFAWPAGYDLNETTITIQSANDSAYSGIYDYIKNNGLSDLFPNGKVLPVNDDVYVVMWVEDSTAENQGKPTSNNINDYLLFWTGTSGKGFWTQNGNTNDDWNRQTPATFISAGKQGVRAFHKAWPNAVGVTAGQANTNVVNNEFSYLAHTDGWYTLTDTSAINSVMRNNYDAIAAGATVHLDLYCFNNDGEGMIDELVVNLATQRETETSVTVNYYYGNVTTPDDTAHFLGSSVLTNQAYGTSISLPAGTNASQLDYMRAAAIIKAGKQDVSNGTQVNNPLVVTRGEDNVINVLYTAKDAQIITLTSNSQELPFDGNPHEIDTLTVTSGPAGGQQNAATKQEDGTWQLPDGNYLQAVTVGATGRYCGKYLNSIAPRSGENFVVKKIDGSDVTNTYTIVEIEGTLTITPVTDFVIDYGLPLDIQPSNMGFDPNGSAAFTLGDAVLQYGGAVLEGSTLTYTPNKTVDRVESIPVSGLEGAGGYTYSGSINIIPATNVLYEENFISTSNEQVVKWTTDGNASSAKQQTAYPGMTGANVYGYDAAYATDQESSAYSNGSALKADLTARCQGRYYTTDSPKATFTFTGTGFDLYSECGANTGALFVTVADDTGAIKKGYMVDTYYNGTLTSNGDATDVSSVMTYQIPVVHDVRDTCGTYTVTVYGYWANREATAMAMAASAKSFEESLQKELGLENVPFEFISVSGADAFATDTEGASTFGVYDEDGTQTAYIDGFRVYNPLVVPDAYTADKEAGPTYVSLFQALQEMGSWSTGVGSTVNSYVFVESADADNVSYRLTGTPNYQTGSGPQNEIYLAPGSAIGFKVTQNENARVMVSAKTINGATSMNTGESEVSISSGTEQYFEAKIGENGTVVITNTGSNILSLVNLKLISTSVATPTDATAFYADVATALDATVTLQDGTVVEPIKPVVPERPVDSEWVNPFVDVHEKDWFYNDVKYTVQNGLFYGMSATEFGPELVMNRAMLVTVLYRIAGEPEVTGEMPFSDVSTGKWYSDAILWAAQNDIVAGIGGGKFAPTATVTREQMATILYRYWKLSNPDADAAGEISESFTDRGSISGWALEAMQWAVENGLIYGVTNTLLDPKGGAPRAQTAAIIARYDRLVSGK